MPRRKITAAQSPVDTSLTDDLPPLTAGEFLAVEAYLAGATKADAYRTAFPKSKKWKARTNGKGYHSLYVQAWRLFARPEVLRWVDAVREVRLQVTSCSKETLLTELARLAKVSEQTGNLGAAVMCQQLRGKAEGLFIEKVQQVSDVPDDVTLLNAIDSLLDNDYPGIRAVAERRLAGDFSDIPPVNKVIVQDYVKLPAP